MAIYSIESGNGQAMSDGIQSEDQARQIAQNYANELGETVYLCRSDRSKPDEIAPGYDWRTMVGHVSTLIADDGTGDMGIIVRQALRDNPRTTAEEIAEIIREARADWAREQECQRRD